MINLDIYCMTVEYFKILDKLPPYIKPLGLGNNIFPKHWLIEKDGENISDLNKHYGEASGFYWVWKNKLKRDDEYILSIKTTNSLKEEVINTIENNHNYDVPEIISTKIDILSEDYKMWFVENLKV